MAKYLMLKHYRGAPPAACVPMDQWSPTEVDAHITYMGDFAQKLQSTGEFVDAQAVAPEEPSWIAPGRSQKSSQTLRPRPSSVTAPSIWYEAVETPKRKSAPRVAAASAPACSMVGFGSGASGVVSIPPSLWTTRKDTPLEAF